MSSSRPPTRELLFESTSFSCIMSLAVDPEGRFLLFQNYANGSLYRVRMDQEPLLGVPELLYDVSALPELAGTRFINPVEHPSSGNRLWVLVEPDDDTKKKALTKRIIFTDAANDGSLDSYSVMDCIDYKPVYLDLDVCEVPWKRPDP